MTRLLLDGKHVAEHLSVQMTKSIQKLKQTGKRMPGLAVILVGEDAASAIYVRNKRIACEKAGIYSRAYDLKTDTQEQDLLALIQQLNQDPEIDGILVQLPLPAHINSTLIIETIVPHKDVDGFHPYNLGRLAQKNPLLRPCTPYGIIELLNYYKLPVQGEHALVIGASNIVGRPMALEFLLAGATVTIAHRFTKNLEQHVRIADIVVVATGIRDVIKSSWLNKNQVIIDVGMHREPNGHLRGDVDFNAAEKIVKAITPVPGGVGPMTIATLLRNTLSAYELHNDK